MRHFISAITLILLINIGYAQVVGDFVYTITGSGKFEKGANGMGVNWKKVRIDPTTRKYEVYESYTIKKIVIRQASKQIFISAEHIVSNTNLSPYIGKDGLIFLSYNYTDEIDKFSDKYTQMNFYGIEAKDNVVMFPGGYCAFYNDYVLFSYNKNEYAEIYFFNKEHVSIENRKR